MRYYVLEKTLVVKGDFAGLSTGIAGGQRRVRAVLNHEVGKDFDHADPVAYMDSVASKLGVRGPSFYFLTAVYMENLCVVRDQQVTAFITAGISNPCQVPGTINIVLVVHGRMSGGAMGSAIITATEAKAKALLEMGFDFTGTTTDAVAVLSEELKTDVCGPVFFEYAGTGTDIGQSIYRCVRKGVEEGIKRQHALVGGNHKSRLFVYAIGDDGPYWVEFPRENCGKGRCEYYPCHFEGQDCTYCYCPLYPCEDPELGEWIKSRRGYPVWTCKDCTILHEKKAVGYLSKHPEATTKKLRSLH